MNRSEEEKFHEAFQAQEEIVFAENRNKFMDDTLGLGGFPYEKPLTEEEKRERELRQEREEEARKYQEFKERGIALYEELVSELRKMSEEELAEVVAKEGFAVEIFGEGFSRFGEVAGEGKNLGDFLYSLGRKEGLPEERFRDLYRCGSLLGLEGIAGNPECPEEILSELSGADRNAIRREVAGNPSTPKEIISSLLRDSDYEVVSAAARNESLPWGEVFAFREKAGARKREAVSLGMAGRKDLHPEVFNELLEELSDHPSYAVERKLAENERTPLKVLDRLYAWGEQKEREGMGGLTLDLFASLAKNPNTRKEILERLAKHPSPFVRGALFENPGITHEMISTMWKSGAKKEEKTIERIASCPATPDYILDEIVRKDECPTHVLHAVLRNENTSPRTLSRLAQEGDLPLSAKLTILANPNFSRTKEIAIDPREVYGELSFGEMVISEEAASLLKEGLEEKRREIRISERVGAFFPSPSRGLKHPSSSSPKISRAELETLLDFYDREKAAHSLPEILGEVNAFKEEYVYSVPTFREEFRTDTGTLGLYVTCPDGEIPFLPDSSKLRSGADILLRPSPEGERKGSRVQKHWPRPKGDEPEEEKRNSSSLVPLSPYGEEALRNPSDMRGLEKRIREKAEEKAERGKLSPLGKLRDFRLIGKVKVASEEIGGQFSPTRKL